MGKFVLICAVSGLFALSTAILGSCDSDYTKPCDAASYDAEGEPVAQVGGSKNIVKRLVAECPKFYCVSTPSKENEVLASCGYCTKTCEADSDCNEGWRCDYVLDRQDLEEFGLENEMAEYKFCIDPQASSKNCDRDTDADNQALEEAAED